MMFCRYVVSLPNGGKINHLDLPMLLIFLGPTVCSPTTNSVAVAGKNHDKGGQVKSTTYHLYHRVLPRVTFFANFLQDESCVSCTPSMGSTNLAKKSIPS